MIDLDDLLFDLAERLAENPEVEPGSAEIDEISRRLLDLSESERNAIVLRAIESDSFRESLMSALASTELPPLSKVVRRTNINGDAIQSVGMQLLVSAITGANGRWVTLTGLVGSGKSRIAKMAALDLVGKFDEVWWVDRSNRLDQAILRQISDDPGMWLNGKAADVIGSRSMLLVLDSFDPKRKAFAEELIQRCPNLSVLAVSNQAIEFSGEVVVPMVDLSIKSAEESVEMMSQMIVRAVGSAMTGTRFADAIRSMSRKLIGAPLAMALAAGCLASTPPATVVSTIDSSSVARHDPNLTIRALVQLSVASLDVESERALRLLSQFRTPFTQERAEMMVDNGSVGPLLLRLERMGLVEVVGSGQSERFTLPRSVSEYLSASPMDPVGRSQYEHVIAKTARDMALSFDLGDWSTGVTMLIDNFDEYHHATQMAIEDGAADVIKSFCETLVRQYFEVTYMDEFELLVNAANSIDQLKNDAELQIKLLGLVGANHARKNELKACGEAWTRRLELSRSIGDKHMEADTLCDLAAHARKVEEFEQSLLFADEGEAVIRELNSVELLATIEVIRARSYQDTKRREDAEAALARTEALLPKCENKDLALFVYQNVALVYEDFGVPEQAKPILLQLLKESSEGHRSVHIGWTLNLLARLNESKGDLESAAKCLVGAKLVFERYASKYLYRANNRKREFLERHPEMEAKSDEFSEKGWKLIVAETLAAED